MESRYEIKGIDPEKRPIYCTEKHSTLLIENTNGTFDISVKQEKLLFMARES
jgi:hypothetical protein